MTGALWPIPALPLAGFLLLTFGGRRLSKGASAAIGVGSVALSALFAVRAVLRLAQDPANPLREALWTWMRAAGLNVGVDFALDPLAAAFVLVITFVGLLIHVYSTEYMSGDESYARFFAYMNLFITAMLTLVLADNLLLLYLGWEGVGLCSYLLIGFWYQDPRNGRAARKAFIVTRVGDVALAIALFLLFREAGRLDFGGVSSHAVASWPVGSALAMTVVLLLLGGAVGKSAQVPLQTWLPDAMAGPTPVSALIHAATMVTAGVYLLARTQAILALAPAAMAIIAVVGALTLLIGAASALAQTDIKRLLAYSTLSQIGYMFLAVGAGAWTAAVFHFLTHAFFKALLFLAAGVVILALHHEQRLERMGGLRRLLPATFLCFTAGAASLAALPLVTAGFYSKDLILSHAWSAGAFGRVLWIAGLAGALLTALYSFRLVNAVFFGPSTTAVVRRPGKAMLIPITILAIFAVVSGFIETPASLGHVTALSDFLNAGSPTRSEQLTDEPGGLPQVMGALVPLAGAFLGYAVYARRGAAAARLFATPFWRALGRFGLRGWGFDALYDALIARPYARLADALRGDPIDWIYTIAARFAAALNAGLAGMQTGRLRLYAAGIVSGAILAIGLALLH